MKRLAILILTVICMGIMISWGDAVSISAKEGVDLCIRAVIPSLFPFFVISTYLNTQIINVNSPLLRPVEKLCKTPYNSGSLFFLSILGGYPVGAQSVAQWYEQGALSKKDAERMLGFCNQAGPAFLFGMLSAFFPSVKFLWGLWLVQIVSAFLTGMFLPGCPHQVNHVPKRAYLTLPQALERSGRSILLVCGWVILFRVLITPISKIPYLCGILELTNGCLQLNTIISLPIRFTVAAVYLSFGGFCVHMQTVSVVKNLSLGWYYKGKLLQTVLAFGLCTFSVLIHYILSS